MRLFNFDRLIRKYSTEFTITQTSGSYIAGKWVSTDGATETRMGALMPLSKAVLMSYGGQYTSSDRRLYVLSKLPEDYDLYRVVVNGSRYKVDRMTDDGDLGGFYSYTLKAVSKFD